MLTRCTISWLMLVSFAFKYIWPVKQNTQYFYKSQNDGNNRRSQHIATAPSSGVMVFRYRWLNLHQSGLSLRFATDLRWDCSSCEFHIHYGKYYYNTSYTYIKRLCTLFFSPQYLKHDLHLYPSYTPVKCCGSIMNSYSYKKNDQIFTDTLNKGKTHKRKWVAVIYSWLISL